MNLISYWSAEGIDNNLGISSTLWVALKESGHLHVWLDQRPQSCWILRFNIKVYGTNPTIKQLSVSYYCFDLFKSKSIFLLLNLLKHIYSSKKMWNVIGKLVRIYFNHSWYQLQTVFTLSYTNKLVLLKTEKSLNIVSLANISNNILLGKCVQSKAVNIEVLVSYYIYNRSIFQCL